MAIALVGFDVDNAERLYGAQASEQSKERFERNSALKYGTYKLYLTFLELQKANLAKKESRTEASTKQVAQYLEFLLIPWLWRNSQTRTPTYEGLLYHSKLYWEANLSGFPWPKYTPRQVGVWAPLGTFAYYYFHYGVVDSPNHLLHYADGAVSLYWQHLSEQFGDQRLTYKNSPLQRWEAVKALLGWRPIDYSRVEDLLLSWLEGGSNPRMQQEMQRLFLVPEHIHSLERQLLAGVISPDLLTFLLAYKNTIREELNDENIQFDWPMSQRWKLGPGGLPQVLLSFLLEALVYCSLLYSSMPEVPYGDFLAASHLQELRIKLAEYLALAYDSLTLLGSLYSDLSDLKLEVVVMLAELLATIEEVPEGEYRLLKDPIDTTALFGDLPNVEPTPDLSPLNKYVAADRSQIKVTLFDRLRLINPPKTVKSNELVVLKVEGRPGTALRVTWGEPKEGVYLYSKDVLINDEGYGFVPIILWNSFRQPVTVSLHIQTVEMKEVRAVWNVLLGGFKFSVNAVLNTFPEFNLLKGLPPFNRVVEYYRVVIPKVHRLEEQLLNKTAPPSHNELTGGNSNVLGIIGSIFKLFSALGKTSPTNASSKNMEKQDQVAYISAATSSMQTKRSEASNLKQEKNTTKQNVEPVSVGSIKPVVKELYEEVIPHAGRAVTAAATALADRQSAGRTLEESHEAWQVRTQHGSFHTTGTFEVHSPYSGFSSQTFSLQARHVLGVHDHLNITSQFLVYRATKLRQTVTENAIDFNNNWYKETSANAHHVAGHFFQYGDELLLQVGKTKDNEETNEAEGEEESATPEAENTAGKADEAANNLEAATNAANNIEGAQNLNNLATQTITETADNLKKVQRFAATIGKFRQSLGPLALAFDGLFGSSGAITTMLSILGGGAISVSQAINQALTVVSLIRNTVDSFRATDPQTGQPLTDAEIAARVANLDSTIVPLWNQLGSLVTTIQNGTAATNVARTAAQQLIQQLSTNIQAGVYNSAVRTKNISPYLGVLAAASLELLGFTGRSISPLTAILGSGSIGSKISTILFTVIPLINGKLGAISNLGTLGNIASALASGLPGAAGAIPSIVNAANNFFAGAGQALDAVQPLGTAASILDALSMSAIPALHKENSQVGKYGHFITKVYREYALDVKRGGFSVRARKDITLRTGIGSIYLQGLRATVMGRLTADFASRGKTNVRGRVVTVKADSVLYLDAPKIIVTTVPIVGEVPALPQLTTVLNQINEIVQKVNEYMEYIKLVFSALGLDLGDGGGAQHMTSPSQVPTYQSTQQAIAPRPQPGGQGPQPVTYNPKCPDLNPTPTCPYSSELAFLWIDPSSKDQASPNA